MVVVILQLLVVLYTGLMILQEVISLNCTNVIALLMSPNTILLIELSMYGTISQTLLSRLLARYPFVVSWLNLIWVIFVLIFNFYYFFLYILFCVITVYCPRCFFHVFYRFIGVSGLRVLPLLINWLIDWIWKSVFVDYIVLNNLRSERSFFLIKVIRNYIKKFGLFIHGRQFTELCQEEEREMDSTPCSSRSVSPHPGASCNV